MRYRAALISFLLLTAFVGQANAADHARLERSVVRIVNYSQRGDWSSPWSLSGVHEMYGSGFVIDGGLIMTNAHVVSDSRYLLVQPSKDPEAHPAVVVHIAHDCDLALVRLEDPAPLDRISPLRFGDLPELGSAVNTLGFPAGGLQISSTRGVVSRIEEQLYVHSGVDAHLTVQTDAAINPGNSGGPVVQDGRVVGVAFQANLDLENTGFFIPPEVIQRFLHDVSDGRYDGYPELGARTVDLVNPAARRYAGLPDDQSGVLIDDVFPASSAEGLLFAGDVILEVEGRKVAGDGSVEDGKVRIPFGLLVDRREIGDNVVVRVLRDGKAVDVTVPLRNLLAFRTHTNLYNVLPRYYIYAGLVFVSLNVEVLKTFGGDWLQKAEPSLLYEYFVRPLLQPELATQERVVLLRRLTHAVNVDMAFFRNEMVEKVNGREIVNLEMLAEIFEEHSGDYHVIEFSSHRRFGVLDRRESEAVHEEILQRYGIREDRNF